MKTVLSISAIGFAMHAGMLSLASAPMTSEAALRQYCEPLIAGATAAQVTKAARESGFKDDRVNGHPVLIQGELILSVSDTPRVCFIQAPGSMNFAEGLALVDSWAARHPGALRGAATKGPDGAPVRVWTVPKQHKYLLVSEQTNGRGDKVLNFILAPLPGT